MLRKVRVLVVDDSYEKSAYLSSVLGCAEVVYKQTVRDALEELKQGIFDLLVCDLQIPIVYGGEVDRSGGKTLIERTVGLGSNVMSPTYIIGVTSHRDSYEEHLGYFKRKGFSLLLCDGGLDGLDSICNSYFSIINSRKEVSGVFDVAVITAIDEEYEAVRSVPIKWDDNYKLHGFDNFKYSVGRMRSDSGYDVNVVLVKCFEMGLINAAISSTEILNKIAPKYIFMTGISAGIKSKTSLGDIVFASLCWDWGAGKHIEENEGGDIFLAAPKQYSPSKNLMMKAEEFCKDFSVLKEIQDIYESRISRRLPESLKAICGPLASGASVLSSHKYIDLIKKQQRNLTAVEMEAFSLFSAVHQISNGVTQCMVIKSVCDFADADKNDEYHEYAAYTSASAFYYFVRKYLL